VSNPPAGDGGLGLRVRPSPEEVDALVVSLGEIPDDEKQVHFEVPLNPSDAEISAMLDMLAEDSSDAAPAETLAVAPIPESGKALDTQRSDSVRPKRPRSANHPTSPAEGKKKKKRHLRRVSCLDQDAGPSAPAAEEVPVPVFAEADPNRCDPTDADPNGCDLDDVDPNGCDPTDADPNGCIARVFDEDEEEEDEIPLIQKNSRRYIASGESSGVPSPTLSALVGLQELFLANFDQTLEDMVPEDLLSEPADGGMMDICADVPNVRLELSHAVSRASSTLDHGLKGQDAGLDSSTPMEVVEGPSALEVAVTGDSALKDGTSAYPAPEAVVGDDPAWMGSVSYGPAPEGVAGDDPARMGSASYDTAPEGVRVDSPSHTSMDVHVGYSPPHSGCLAVAQASGQEVALEVGAPDDRVLIFADDTNLVPTDALRVVPVGDPLSSHHLSSHDLGVPSFFSNLHVIWSFLIWLYPGCDIVLYTHLYLSSGVG
jgi:hypothetical protein